MPLASHIGEPPSDISPERLFRLMLRPMFDAPIELRIAGAEDVALSVRPVRGIDEQVAADDAADIEHEPSRISRIIRGLIALTLYADAEPAFTSSEDVGALSSDEVSELGAAVLTTLDRFAPSYLRSNVKTWLAKLEEGARHPTNLREAYALASCLDDGPHWTVARPDRYWGLRPNQLLDHNWMVYRAAREATKENAVDPKRALAAYRKRTR